MNSVSEPTVCATLLTRDRPELARKAVECFRAQTYEKKRLLVWNTGPHGPLLEDPEALDTSSQLHEPWIIGPVEGLTIGELRNDAAECAIDSINPEIFVHWDDDDHNHPNRITEQVALLQASGADVVGYSDMLFWRYCRGFAYDPGFAFRMGEAWLYASTKGGVPTLGTSLCYKRSVWEKHHFANETQGVEDHWMREKHIAAVSCLSSPDGSFEPRMIARIHGGNTSNGYKLEEYIAAGSREWTRVPAWDQRVRGILG
jgi:hypothetical protein